MTEILKLTYGIYPKTEKLRIRIGRWERGILGAGELEALIGEETQAFQSMAREKGISSFTDPLFNWYDIFRPLSVLSGGIELGPLTRYGETNTFYRLPEIRGDHSLKSDPSTFAEISDNPPMPLYHVDQGEDQLAFLPGPETFFHFCGNTKGSSFEDFASALGKYYLSVLGKFRFRNVLIFESVPLSHGNLSSFYSYVKPENTFLFTVGSLDAASLASAGEKFRSVLTTPSGSNLEAAKQHSQVPGLSLVDAHNTKIEDAAELTAKLSSEAEKAGLSRIYLTHSNYLDFLPRQIADRKVELMGRIGE